MQGIKILTLRGKIEIALRKILRKKKKQLLKYKISMHSSAYLFMFSFKATV